MKNKLTPLKELRVFKKLMNIQSMNIQSMKINEPLKLMKPKKKLNLGAGKINVKEGYVNLDMINYPEIDVVWDLNKLPLPFKDEEFDEILARNILEHVNYVPLMNELYRILKPKGKIKIGIPHFTSMESYSDPTHINFFSYLTMSYFVKGGIRDYPFMKFSKWKAKIRFQKRLIFPWNYIMEWFVNLNLNTIKLYEKTPLRIFSAMNITGILTK